MLDADASCTPPGCAGDSGSPEAAANAHVAECIVDGRRYAAGDTFADPDGCNRCACEPSGIACPDASCDDPRARKPDSGSQPSCERDGTRYDVGTELADEDCHPSICTTEGWTSTEGACAECGSDEDCPDEAPYCNLTSCEESAACGQVPVGDPPSCEIGCDGDDDCPSPMRCVGSCDGPGVCRAYDFKLEPACTCDGDSYATAEAIASGEIDYLGWCEFDPPQAWYDQGCECGREGETAIITLVCLEIYDGPRDPLEDHGFLCNGSAWKERSEGCGMIRVAYFSDESMQEWIYDAETHELIGEQFGTDFDSGICGVRYYRAGTRFDCPEASDCELCDDPEASWTSYPTCPLPDGDAGVEAGP